MTRRTFVSWPAGIALAQKKRQVFVVPNFHPASCGWLTNFSKERVYCANSYFDHLDKVRDDPNYAFVLSECNNMIAMMNFQPGRTEELKRRIREGRVELVNAFFLESTINLSGGEALVRIGVEGLRWQEQVFGVRPRWAWNIDVCGTHEQMAQIAAGLGLEAIVYTRKNPTGSSLHWLVSPDGTRTPAVAPGHYSSLGEVFGATAALTAKEVEEIRKTIAEAEKITPTGAPVLVLGGKGDYALAPARKDYPTAFMKEWPEVRFTTLAKYMDEVLPRMRSGEMKVPEHRGGTAYDFYSFWMECPRVKSWFRRSEHALQYAEMTASIESLKTEYKYPAEELYKAWLQLFLNMDRNTLWGAAGGMVFEHERSWDVKDRFESIGAITEKILGKRNETPEAATACEVPEVIETKHYTARVDKQTGALASLRVKPSGREVLGGAANVVVMERATEQKADPGDFMQFRPLRRRLASTEDGTVTVTATRSKSALIVTAEGPLRCKRVMKFYDEPPRIDFETTLTDVEDRTVVVAEFPLAGDVTEALRGIPYGFTKGLADEGIAPAVRWSNYSMEGGGIAILDQGLSGRELNGRTPVIYLLNATEKYYGYPNSWLSGKGEHVLRYAVVAHDGDWRAARIPHLAWEFNGRPLKAPELAASDNVIVESVRREGGFLEVRMAECYGRAGTAELKLTVPHKGAWVTNMVGGAGKTIRGGPTYKFEVRPQQIVTLRFGTASKIEATKPILEWDELVPLAKRAALHEYSTEKGHPPRGN